MLDFLTLPARSHKPRQSGLTHVLDKGLGGNQITDLLDTAADYIDILKLGWGTAAVTPHLDEKIRRYQGAGIPVCFGGTFLEVALRQKKLKEYIACAKGFDMECIELSDGTIDIPQDEKLDLLRRLSKDFRVLSEVGSKDDSVVIPPNKWVDLIQAELDAGAWKVITEGRESGTVGIYQSSGEVKAGLMDEIVEKIDPDQLLFEAPNKKQQVWFVKKFGTNVNLGNIAPDEVISVETIRVGVRGDTLLNFH